MNERERLIELLKKVDQTVSEEIAAWEVATVEEMYGSTADHLLANGVTVQRWIPVTERLPSVKKIIDGETYFKNVAVRVKDCGFEKIAYYDDEEKCWFDPTFFPDVGEVTHWCELPEWNLPQPPKEEK